MTTMNSRGCSAVRHFRWSQNPQRQRLLESTSHTSIDPPTFAASPLQRRKQPLMIPARLIHQSRCLACSHTVAKAVASKSP
jgi:hypothetical protein